MLRQAYERELLRLQDEVLALGSMVAKALLKSVSALIRRDLETSRRLVAGDQVINQKRFAIEADIMALIATQQPAARDLRSSAAMLEVVTELERIGDYAKGIARISLMIAEAPLIQPMVELSLMADKAVNMLHRALEAFMRQNADLARAIPQDDDEVDQLYNEVYCELIAHITRNPSAFEQATHLLWAAHNLERAADRVTNICERVVYTATGEMIEMDVEDSVAVGPV